MASDELKNIEEIHFKDSMTHIYSYSFYSSDFEHRRGKIKKVVFPSSIKEIQGSAFELHIDKVKFSVFSDNVKMYFFSFLSDAGAADENYRHSFDTLCFYDIDETKPLNEKQIDFMSNVNALLCSHYNTQSGITYKRRFSTKFIVPTSEILWMQRGKCRYCGGTLKFFNNKCKECGKTNNYDSYFFMHSIS